MVLDPLLTRGKQQGQKEWAQQLFSKGQIKPKSVWARHRFSQKTNERICFVCREKQKSKQNKFVSSFLGESTARQSGFGFI